MSTLTSFINRYFGLEKKQSNIKTEVIAGLTTFVAMAYVIFVNPAIISQAGIPMEAAVAATIWTACLCSIAMGLFAKRFVKSCLGKMSWQDNRDCVIFY